jgi:hypothetical protein
MAKMIIKIFFRGGKSQDTYNLASDQVDSIKTLALLSKDDSSLAPINI